MKKNTSSNEGKMIAATAAGAAAVGAGAYYFFGPNAKANQKKAKAIFEKMKKEVSKEARKAKAISVPIYNKAVDVISKNYAKQYKLHEKDIKAVAEKLKKEWKEISRTMKSAGKPSPRKTKTGPKKTSKKAK